MAANDREIEAALAASLQQQEEEQMRAALLLSQMSTHQVPEDDLTRALRESRRTEEQREDLMASAAAELSLRQAIEEEEILEQLTRFTDQQEEEDEEDEEDEEESAYVRNTLFYRPQHGAVMDQQPRDVTEDDEDELLRRAMQLSMQSTFATPQQGGASSSRPGVAQQYPVAAAAAAAAVVVPAPAPVMTPLRAVVSKREQLEIKVASIFLRLKQEVSFKPDCDDSAVKFVLENLIKANGDKEINGVNLLTAFDARKKVDNPNLQKKLYEPLRAALVLLAEKDKAKAVNALQQKQ